MQLVVVLENANAWVSSLTFLPSLIRLSLQSMLTVDPAEAAEHTEKGTCRHQPCFKPSVRVLTGMPWGHHRSFLSRLVLSWRHSYGDFRVGFLMCHVC